MGCSNEDIIKMVSGKKKFFLKSFLISVVLFLLSAAILYFGRETWASMTQSFWGLQESHYYLAAALLMGSWKILIIQFTLVPFLALFCAEKCMKKNADKCS